VRANSGKGIPAISELSKFGSAPDGMQNVWWLNRQMSASLTPDIMHINLLALASFASPSITVEVREALRPCSFERTILPPFQASSSPLRQFQSNLAPTAIICQASPNAPATSFFHIASDVLRTSTSSCSQRQAAAA
jgi:hypothetical protein